MKPKTKVEKEIVALSNQLPPLTKVQMDWVMENATAHIGFYNKQRIWCTECGCSVPITPNVDLTKDDFQDIGDTFVCPCCGAKLDVTKSRKIKYETKEYVTFITTKGGYQVLRHFLLCQNSRMERETGMTFCEAVQEWIAPSGDIHFISRPRNANTYYYDNWIFYKDMEIRKVSDYCSNAYRIYANYIYPHMRVLPQLRQYGFKSSFHGVTPSTLFSSLLKHLPNVEWLLKSKQYDMMAHSVYYGICYRDSVKICIRNNYKIRDVQIWKDYLGCLEYFGKDLHNAHYVCPADLKKSHDYWMRKKEIEENRRREEERRRDAVKWEDMYAKQKHKYIGITFNAPGINVSVLPSVAAFVEEAKCMHHCVYSMGYYKKPESLILSAKDDNGKRLETIEVNLKTFTIVQCYGACNKFTPQHEQIKELVNQNMNLIRKAG